MAGSHRNFFIATLIVVLSASAASAYRERVFGWGWEGNGGCAYYPMTYYYAVPVYSPTSVPLPAANAPMPYAETRPAPPSETRTNGTPAKITIPKDSFTKPETKAPEKSAPEKKAPTNKEPPALNSTLPKGPMVSESRSQSTTAAQKGGKDRCKVGFWNLTGRDITLNIDGKERSLAKDRAVTLDLDRAFQWRIDSREATGEQVPDELAFFEVIIRK